jgi:hypothetical protein
MDVLGVSACLMRVFFRFQPFTAGGLKSKNRTKDMFSAKLQRV